MREACPQEVAADMEVDTATPDVPRDVVLHLHGVRCVCVFVFGLRGCWGPSVLHRS